ncbi:unnamed protein product, partial [Sphagnum tenellum]
MRSPAEVRHHAQVGQDQRRLYVHVDEPAPVEHPEDAEQYEAGEAAADEDEVGGPRDGHGEGLQVGLKGGHGPGRVGGGARRDALAAHHDGAELVGIACTCVVQHRLLLVLVSLAHLPVLQLHRVLRRHGDGARGAGARPGAEERPGAGLVGRDVAGVGGDGAAQLAAAGAVGVDAQVPVGAQAVVGAHVGAAGVGGDGLRRRDYGRARVVLL